MTSLIRNVAAQQRRVHLALLLGMATALLGSTTQTQAACNIRGEHCGRPAWAANAFSSRLDRVPEEALEPKREAREIRHHEVIHASKPSRVEKVVKKVMRERIAKKLVMHNKTATQTSTAGAVQNASKGASSHTAPEMPSQPKIKTAESETGATAQKAVAPAAAPVECKKYFPSVGQMISVPCPE